MARLGWYFCVESRLFQLPHANVFFLYFLYIVLCLPQISKNEIDKQLPLHIIAYLCNENQILNT